MRLEAWAPVLARPRPGDPRGAALDREYDIQIGLANPAILVGLDREERQFVGSLEGGRLVTEREAARFASALARLADAGVLHDDASQPASPRATAPMGAVAIDARTPLARLIAETCAAAWLDVYPAAEAPSDAVHVIAFVGAPDARDAQRLVRNRTPHILVACDERGAWVSHVVAVGMTPCSRCRDIALTRADSAWPFLAAQLSGTRAFTGLSGPRAMNGLSMPPLLAAPTTAVRVAARLVAWFAKGDPGVGERIGPDAVVTEACLAPESECGCGAAGPVGDEVTARRARLGV